MSSDIEFSGIFEELFEYAPCSFITVASNGEIINANKAFSLLTGYSHAEILESMQFSDFLAAAQKIYFQTHFTPLLELQGSVNEIAFDIRCRDQTLTSVLVNATIRQLAAEGTKVTLMALFNATDRRRYENDLLAARRHADAATEREREAKRLLEQASLAKDNFLAMVSHELRTPLNAILGWTQMLQKNKALETKTIEGLSIIERNARIQAQLIEDLLDLSRVISGKMRLDVQQIFLSEVVEAAIDTARPAADAKGLRIQTTLDPGVEVWGDPGRLQQVFWNLLTNAIKFTPKEGYLRVVILRINSHVEVSVIDSGKGMTADFIDHAFEMFSQSNTKESRQSSGLGLGLSIVKNIIEMHGGSISASSEGPGQGSTFLVSIPVVTVTQSKMARVYPRPAISSRQVGDRPDSLLENTKILVIDDQQDAREMVRLVLADAGAEVYTAASVDEALLLLGNIRLHILISDIGMPEQDGYEFIRQVRMLGTDISKIPAIALTAFSRVDDRTQAMLAGFQRHLSKPIDAHELVLTVKSLLGHK